MYGKRSRRSARMIGEGNNCTAPRPHGRPIHHSKAETASPAKRGSTSPNKAPWLVHGRQAGTDEGRWAGAGKAGGTSDKTRHPPDPLLPMQHTISQRFFFDAAHTLRREIEAEGSRRVHGHTYHAEVALTGA